LLNLVFTVCPIVLDIHVYDGIHELFWVTVKLCYETWTAVVQGIPQFMCWGLCLPDAERSSISLKFWRVLCFWEREDALRNGRTNGSETELRSVCTEQALQNCDELHPWIITPLHDVTDTFMKEGLPLLVAVLFDANRSPEDTSSALSVLRVLGTGWPDPVFPFLFKPLYAQPTTDSSYARCLLLCLDLFCS
jgi:hypothetical protein